MALLYELNRFLNRSNRIHLLLLSLLVVVSGVMEILGIASIMPFMGAVLNPDFITHNLLVSKAYRALNFSNPNDFLVVMGMAVLAVIVLSNLASAATIWGILKFSLSLGRDLSQKLLASYLSRPYVFFIDRNSSELVSNTLWEVGRIVNGILVPLLTIYARSVVGLSILCLLLWVDPWLAVISGLVLGGAYLAVFFLVRKTLSTGGRELSEVNDGRTRIAYEIMGGIKDIKILGREKDFFDRFSRPSQLYSSCQARSQMIALLPRYALETLAFGGIIVIVIYLLRVEHGASAKAIEAVAKL